MKTNPKFPYRFGIDYLMKSGHQSQSFRFIEAYQPGTILQREAKAYQEEWLSTLRGKSFGNLADSQTTSSVL